MILIIFLKYAQSLSFFDQCNNNYLYNDGNCRNLNLVYGVIWKYANESRNEHCQIQEKIFNLDKEITNNLTTLNEKYERIIEKIRESRVEIRNEFKAQTEYLTENFQSIQLEADKNKQMISLIKNNINTILDTKIGTVLNKLEDFNQDNIINKITQLVEEIIIENKNDVTTNILEIRSKLNEVKNGINQVKLDIIKQLNDMNPFTNGKN